jgi:hypothetical protein
MKNLIALLGLFFLLPCLVFSQTLQSFSDGIIKKVEQPAVKPSHNQVYF